MYRSTGFKSDTDEAMTYIMAVTARVFTALPMILRFDVMTARGMSVNGTPIPRAANTHTWRPLQSSPQSSPGQHRLPPPQRPGPKAAPLSPSVAALSYCYCNDRAPPYSHMLQLNCHAVRSFFKQFRATKLAARQVGIRILQLTAEFLLHQYAKVRVL